MNKLIVTLLFLGIFFVLQPQRDLTVAQTTYVSPTFNCIGTANCVPSPTLTQPVARVSAPVTTSQSPSQTAPSTNPCTQATISTGQASTASDFHRKRKRKKNGKISKSYQSLLNYFVQLINMLLKLLGQTPLPSTGNPSPTPTISTIPSVPVVSSSPSTILNPCPSATPKQPSPTLPQGITPTQPVSTGTWWKPGPTALEWQWEIGHALSLSSAADMGTGKTAFNGAKAPATDPVVYDIDGFDNTAATVSSLHAMGKKVVCYIEVGADDGRSDSPALQATGEGNTMQGWNEKYIDIRNPAVVKIIKARIAMCAQKGFDAIEPDIDESYASSTGFPLTKAIEEAYMTDLANYAHSLGVAMWGKNPDDTGDSYAADMVNVFDAILTEECNQNGTCDALATYTGKKPIFNAEYSLSPSNFCAADNARVGWNGAQFNLNLDGTRNPCR